jgi:hypothetical protein
MTDKIRMDDSAPIRLRDMGDGTFAEVVAGAAYTSEVTITRPSNTTAYTAGDVIGVADAGTPANAGSAIHELANIGPAGGWIMITAADLMVYVTGVPAGMTSFRLHLYSASPTAILDNAAWDLPAGDRAGYLGYIDLGSPADVGSTLYVQAEQINKQVKLAAGSTSLYAELVSNGGFTPASGAVKKLRASAVAL